MLSKTLFLAITTVAAAVLSAGCATTSPVVVPVESLRTEPVVVPATTSETAEAGIQKSSLSSFTTLVQWPDRPPENDCASFVVKNEVNDGVLIEGRAYVRRTLDDIYGDIITPDIIGPVHMTREITRDAFEETPLKTTFVLHSRIKYIITLDLDLTWTIEPVFENGKRVGYYATAEKTGGTGQIKQISNKLQILEIEPGLVSAEISSFNKAIMNKTEESKAYVTMLFDVWSNICHATPADAADSTTEPTDETDASVP